MGKLIVTEFMTLDGVAQAPGGPEEDPEGGFTHGGWQAPLIQADDAQTGGDELLEEASRMDALLLGRRTYEIFAGFWPNAPKEDPFTELLNRVPKYVASRTLTEPLEWNESTLLQGDLPAAVAEVKDRHDEVHVIGSLDLVQSLLQERLVDRLRLWQYPLVLGTGKRVFAHGTVPAALRLTHSVTHPNGSVQLTYDLAGEPTYGDMTVID
jgi:dihydrofolate reductase